MTEQPGNREQAFLAKLNHFLAALEPHEQAWLATLVTSGGAAQEVQGYLLPAVGGTLALPAALPPVTIDLRKAGGDSTVSGTPYVRFLSS